LQGAFDFDLTYALESLEAPVGSGVVGGGPIAGPAPPAPAAQGGSSLFDALRDQLGLRLDGGRAPVDVLVVDQVQPPTEN
jgi:uncharacterized protein (TIGR03435 family)